MVTPDELRAEMNPITGRTFGKEIRLGLDTRHLPTARRRRGAILGQLRQFQECKGRGADFTLEDALGWREDIAEARRRDPAGDSAEAMELALTDVLGRAEERGSPTSKLKSFARVAFREGFPVSLAEEQYISERSPGNAFNFKPLKPATVRELRIALGHLRDFLGDTDETACLEDVSPETAREFR